MQLKPVISEPRAPKFVFAAQIFLVVVGFNFDVNFSEKDADNDDKNESSTTYERIRDR